MATEQMYQILEVLDNINITDKRKSICMNIKNFRKQKYDEYKKQNKGANGINNPFSTENVASYLGISKVHYKRIENPKEKFKFITLENLIKLGYIFNKELTDFIKLH